MASWNNVLAPTMCKAIIWSNVLSIYNFESSKYWFISSLLSPAGYKDIVEPGNLGANTVMYFKQSTLVLCCIDWYVIQIKICAEYRDMLPRPRLVCQEPGLRPIGRSPGVPDKSSRGLGSMSRYSAQILICFIAYIFSIFNFSVGLVGNLAELPPCTVPPATVHCYQNEAAQCSSDNQISQHALLRGSRKKHSLAFMPQNWWN